MTVDAKATFGEPRPLVTEPRPGQIINKAQIEPGGSYFFRSSNKSAPQGFLSQPVTVLEGPQLSERGRTFIKCKVDYSEEQLAKGLIGNKGQTTRLITLSDVGITEEGEFKPGTSIWLAATEEKV
jgi:hypothetical protein